MILYGFFSYVHYAKIAKKDVGLGSLTTFYNTTINDLPADIKSLSPNSITIVGPLLRYIEKHLNLPKDALKLSRYEMDLAKDFYKEKELVPKKNREDFLSMNFPPFNEQGNKLAYIDGGTLAKKMDLESEENIHHKIYTLLAICNTIMIGQRMFLTILNPGAIESASINELQVIQKMISTNTKLSLNLLSSKKVSTKPTYKDLELVGADWYNTTDAWVKAYQELVQKYPKLTSHNNLETGFVQSLKTIRLKEE